VEVAVKICGVTTPEDAVLAAELGATYLGLNFYPESPRHLPPERAREIAGAVRDRVGPRVRLVGLFVNAPPERVREVDAAVGLDLLQFHGDETPAEIAPFAERAIRVFRVRDRLDGDALAGCEGYWGVLIDSRHPRLYGGSGESWDFASLAAVRRAHRRIFIAGGLGPDNVRAAVAAARPYGVDLCSGVESEPGRKDPGRLRRLFEELEEL
jgi:phosphoribosylanthranilate isomerase